MEIELTRIDGDADVYDVRKAVAHVLHGPDLFDPNDPNNRGRKPNFLVEMGKSPDGSTHNGNAILRVATKLGRRLLRWNYSQENNIVVNGYPLRLFDAHQDVSPNVKQIIERALYIDPDQERLRKQIEDKAREVRLGIEKLQFGVWYKPSNSPGKGRSFSIEYERDFLQQSAAYVSVVYEQKLIHIDVSTSTQPPRNFTYPFTQIGQRETEENHYKILVKFSNIRKLGLGYDEFEQPCGFLWHHYQRFP